MERRFYRQVQLANTLTPALGLLLSIPGLAALLVEALRHGNDWDVASFAVYGTSLVVSYAVFTLYHIFKFHRRWGRLFKVLDHATIYLLIAGTYTPFTLICMRGHWGWTLFGIVWGLTICGVLFKIFFVHRFKVLGPLLYLAMGWLLLIAIVPALRLIPHEGLLLLLAGGLFYSGGLVFYAWKRLRFHHAIWHLFVLAGSACHFFAVYILPRVGS